VNFLTIRRVNFTVSVVAGIVFIWIKLNAILDYLDTRKNELSNEMMAVGYHSRDYQELEGMYEVYSHLIAKIEDDFR